jgi:hypothetical protein
MMSLSCQFLRRAINYLIIFFTKYFQITIHIYAWGILVYGRRCIRIVGKFNPFENLQYCPYPNEFRLITLRCDSCKPYTLLDNCKIWGKRRKFMSSRDSLRFVIGNNLFKNICAIVWKSKATVWTKRYLKNILLGTNYLCYFKIMKWYCGRRVTILCTDRPSEFLDKIPEVGQNLLRFCLFSDCARESYLSITNTYEVRICL